MTESVTESVTLPGYTLGSSGREQERLRVQADDLRPQSEELFARLGVRPGWQAVDLGCGPRGNLDLLASLTGPAGQVTGVDVNPEHVRLAAGFAAERGLGNVTVRCADARATGLPAGSSDLVYARLLLINIPWPADVVAEMARLARPGGWVAGEEADAICICDPPHEAWDRLTALLFQAWQLAGADLNMGRQMAGFYRAAGLTEVGTRVRADLHPSGHRRRMIVPELVRSLRPRILDTGLLTERELDDLDRVARAHIEAPGTVMLPMLYFTTWGRKPG